MIYNFIAAIGVSTRFGVSNNCDVRVLNGHSTDIYPAPVPPRISATLRARRM